MCVCVCRSFLVPDNSLTFVRSLREEGLLGGVNRGGREGKEEGQGREGGKIERKGGKEERVRTLVTRPQLVAI